MSLSHEKKQHFPSVAFKAIRAAEACSLLLGPMEPAWFGAAAGHQLGFAPRGDESQPPSA
jgi:hypothetical protein